jgi:hypothetical protein
MYHSRIAPYYFVIILSLFLNACSRTEPLDILKGNLKDVPAYSIILDDMKKEGAFFPSYYHKYKIVQDSEERITDWEEVSEQFYKRYQNFLGMTLVAKTKDGLDTTPSPPGYDHIGDPRYGQWRKDNNGNSFWEFYGKYALFRDALSAVGGLMGRNSGRIYRDDYDDYRRYEERGRPYYGPRHEYGTQGTYTKKSNPGFFERRKEKIKQRNADFKARARSRMGRTRSTYSSRSWGFGK